MTTSTYRKICVEKLKSLDVWSIVCHEITRLLSWYDIQHRLKPPSSLPSLIACTKSTKCQDMYNRYPKGALLSFKERVLLWKKPTSCSDCSDTGVILPDGILDKLGQYALHAAVLFGQYSKAKTLLKSGVDTMIKLSFLEVTPLVLSVILDHEEMFKLLWDYTPDRMQRTECLHISAYVEAYGTMRFIADKGHFDDKNCFGNTVLHEEMQRDNTAEVSQFLLELGADVECLNARGETPLLTACQYGKLHNVPIILRYGACVNALNDKGRTALSIIREYPSPQPEEQQELLKSCEAGIQQRLYVMKLLGLPIHPENVQLMEMLDDDYKALCEKHIDVLKFTLPEIGMTNADLITAEEDDIMSRTLPQGLSPQKELRELLKLERFYRCTICHCSDDAHILIPFDAILKWKCRKMYRIVVSQLRTKLMQVITQLLPRDLPDIVSLILSNI